MDGRGLVSEAPAYSHTDRIFIYAKNSVLKTPVEPVTSSAGVTYSCMNDSASSVGPIMGFAEKMAYHYPDDVILVVPCSKGSTSINQWRRLPTTDNLYGATQARIQEALDAAKAQWPSDVVRLCGTIFWQGAGDSTTQSDATAWREDFGKWVADYRADIADLNHPIVYAVLNSLSPRPSNQPYWMTLRGYMNGIYIRKTKSANVDSPAVTYQADKTHPTALGSYAAGQIFANSMIDLL